VTKGDEARDRPRSTTPGREPPEGVDAGKGYGTPQRYVSPHRWATAEIRRRIAAGTYAVNSYLPPERDLAVELGIGRRSLRRAMAQLEREGLVERTRGRGTRVLRRLEKIGRIAILSNVSRNALLGYPEARLVAAGCHDRLAQANCSSDYLRFIRDPDLSLPPTIRPIPIEDIRHLHEQYDGLVFVECGHPPVIEYLMELERRRYPVVVANMESDLALSGSRVDHGKIMQKAVEILVGFGHRRIGYVGHKPGVYFYGRALEGYQRGLREAGLQPDDSLVALCEKSTSIDAFLAAQALLALPDPPTAIVAARDLFAGGVCRAVEHRGAHIGRDISVIGYDDISWPQEEPILTTFREPCYELGVVAAEMLTDRIANGWRKPERRVVDAPLVLRRSAGPAPESAGAKPADGRSEGAVIGV